jgi:hypothetical protein
MAWPALPNVRLTNQPDAVRCFDAEARNLSDIRAGVAYAGNGIAGQLKVGEQSRVDGRQGRFALDGGYVAGTFNNLLVYGGLVDQWYGPGWRPPA